ncbi:MAG: nucleotidyltransferase domain-containing protein [Deltaproteobacteria bacterium]|nr:MAG: nucleotidyltransferase domain-containing protein [Deltaproteobacteria bacterium]
MERVDSSLSDAVLRVIAKYPEIRLVIVFGSLAEGAGRRDSDVDVAVGASRPLTADQKLSLTGDLAEATGRPVDVIDLRTAGEPLLGQILSGGRRIAGSDEEYAALITRHLIDSADFLPYRDRILAERRRAWIGK